jgi:hypothetical protein
LRIPSNFDRIQEAVRQVNAKLLIVDPASAFLDCNENSERDVRRVLTALAAFAAGEGLAVLLVRHFNKTNNGNALYKGLGSIGWTAVPRAVLAVIDDPTASECNCHLVVPLKSNLGAAPSLCFRTRSENSRIVIDWLRRSDFTLRDFAGDVRLEASRRREAATLLYTTLRDGESHGRDVHACEAYRRAAEEGVSKRTLERAKLALGVRSDRELTSFGWRWIWRLPDERNELLRSIQEKYANWDEARAQ